MWRAWVLWGGGWKVLIIPYILILTGAGTHNRTIVRIC